MVYLNENLRLLKANRTTRDQACSSILMDVLLKLSWNVESCKFFSDWKTILSNLKQISGPNFESADLRKL